jgi:hypothetical protein
VLFRRGKPYSQDLRERVFAAADEGGKVGQIARLLRVSVSFVSKVLSRRRESGETTARPQRCASHGSAPRPRFPPIRAVRQIMSRLLQLDQLAQFLPWHDPVHLSQECGTPSHFVVLVEIDGRQGQLPDLCPLRSVVLRYHLL